MDIHIYLHNEISSGGLPGDVMVVRPAAGCGCLECHSKLDAVLLAVSSVMVAVQSIVEKEIQVDSDVQAMITQATQNENAEAAASLLLQSLFGKLAAAVAGTGPISAADRLTIQKTVKDMQTSSTAMAAAIVANTPASAVTVTPPSLSLSLSGAGSQSAQLAVVDSTGKDITPSAEYSSGDPTVASVSTSGLVTAVRVGSTVITVDDANGANGTTVPVAVAA
jgi:hypothetical protein